jgi:hypothetical protein
VKEISLNDGSVALIDDEDFELMSMWKWQMTNGYAARTSGSSGNKKAFRMHRVVMCLDPSDKRTVDHIDGNRLNNQKVNLRFCTRFQNNMNSIASSRSSSGLKGIYLCKKSNKWRAQIGHDKKRIFLGLFLTKEEAHEAYCKKARELFGDFFHDGSPRKGIL